MAQIASEALVERLADWGVDTVFGLPGDGINGIMEGFRRHQDRVKFVLVHHEEAAAFMATAHAKATGQIGVCLATSGPGGIHLLNGLYDAKLDHMPVLAITGMQETSVLGTGYQQEVNLDKLYAGRRGLRPDDLQPGPAARGGGHRGAHRVRPARGGPPDPAERPAGGQGRGEPVRRGGPGPDAGHRADPAGRPWPAFRRGPAATSRRAERRPESWRSWPERGALHAREQLLAVAETLGAPIIKTLSGKATVPDDSPYTTGGIGLLGTAPSEELMSDLDTLLMVGTNFPYTHFMPEPGKARIVQIEADPARAGARVPTEVPVVGDAKESLAALLPLLKPRSDTAFLAKYQKQMESWRKKMAALADERRDPIAPEYVVAVLDELAAEDAILTCDSGTIATWAARHWQIRAGRQFYLSGNLATMAPGLPYAIGIQHAFPGRQVIGYVGDGGFAMLMAEFITAIKHQLPVKIVINNNNSLGQILWEQMVLGYPEYGVRHSDPFTDYTAVATANGALGIKVTSPAEVRPALSEALRHDGPALVDVNVNPDEPPLPGKVEYKQAVKFAEAFLRGQPRKATIATTLFRDKIDQLRA